MMIRSSLLFILLLSFHKTCAVDPSFYAINVPLIEHCSPTGRIVKQNTLNPSQLMCFEQSWRQISITSEYICTQNLYKNIWTFKTEKNNGSPWPNKIQILTVYGKHTGYTLHTSRVGTNGDKEIIHENGFTFGAAQNPLTTYLWVANVGPYCRVKYNIPNDICTAKSGRQFSLIG